jgi:hypothetical protein
MRKATARDRVSEDALVGQRVDMRGIVVVSNDQVYKTVPACAFIDIARVNDDIIASRKYGSSGEFHAQSFPLSSTLSIYAA